jgi:ABC-type multidrug transport system ATPase subunit
MDETDSGLDIDALKVVSEGINNIKAQRPDMTVLLITHYQRMLNYIKPDYVHVMVDGRIIRSGGPELALELEEKGYDWVREPARSTAATPLPARVSAIGDGRGRDEEHRPVAWLCTIADLPIANREVSCQTTNSRPVGARRIQVRLPRRGGVRTSPKGADEEIVREISEQKGEPEWMLKYRLKALKHARSGPGPPGAATSRT